MVLVKVFYKPQSLTQILSLYDSSQTISEASTRDSLHRWLKKMLMRQKWSKIVVPKNEFLEIIDFLVYMMTDVVSNSTEVQWKPTRRNLWVKLLMIFSFYYKISIIPSNRVNIPYFPSRFATWDNEMGYDKTIFPHSVRSSNVCI